MKSELAAYYVYVYQDPRKFGPFKYGDGFTFNFEPFYVGKGTKHRVRSHLAEAKNPNRHSNIQKCEKILNIIESSSEPIISIFGPFSEKEALGRERFLIRSIGRDNINEGPLTNILPGSSYYDVEGVCCKKPVIRKVNFAPWWHGNRISSSSCRLISYVHNPDDALCYKNPKGKTIELRWFMVKRGARYILSAETKNIDDYIEAYNEGINKKGFFEFNGYTMFLAKPHIWRALEGHEDQKIWSLKLASQTCNRSVNEVEELYIFNESNTFFEQLNKWIERRSNELL